MTTSPQTRVEVAVLGRLDMFSHNQGTTILLRRRASLRVAPLTPCSLLLPTLAKGREKQVTQVVERLLKSIRTRPDDDSVLKTLQKMLS